MLLASASPRRRRLIGWLGADADFAAADTEEDLTGPLRLLPPVLARSLAADKARVAAESAPDRLVLAFDTIVLLDREILGKPADADDARRMLRALSGRAHQVITGVALLVPPDDEPVTFAVTTPVTMRELDDDAISAWLAEGEALGCAGAYNIERHLASVVAGECYQNVAGLPLCHLYARLERLGVDGLTPPVQACDRARDASCTLGPRMCGPSANPGV